MLLVAYKPLAVNECYGSPVFTPGLVARHWPAALEIGVFTLIAQRIPIRSPHWGVSDTAIRECDRVGGDQ
jgi:hypothetical protein